MSTTKKIKWGIIGCGNIANKFANDLALVIDAELTAVASRSLERAQEFAEKHNATKAYDSYEKLFLDGEVDIVYIATPHISHAELSIRAMEHGKHVLCEKPIALNTKEATAMIETSQKTNQFFMEALWTRFNPSLIAIKNRIDNGEIGDIKFVNANFSFKFYRAMDSRAIMLELGGGAILDIGIYPAFLTYLFLGIPKEILATSIFHEITKCDMQTSMIFGYEDSQAILYSSFASKSELVAKISGTEGEIIISDPWHAAQSYSITKGEETQKIDLPLNGIGFTYEIEECHKNIRANKIESDLWSHQNSLDLISILDIVRKKVGLKYPQESL